MAYNRDHPDLSLPSNLGLQACATVPSYLCMYTCMFYLGFVNSTSGFHEKFPYMYTVYFEEVHTPLLYSFSPPHLIPF
jgi:hypothetical protein